MHLEQNARRPVFCGPVKIGLRRGKGLRLTEKSRMVDRISVDVAGPPRGRHPCYTFRDHVRTADESLGGDAALDARTGDSGLDYP